MQIRSFRQMLVLAVLLAVLILTAVAYYLSLNGLVAEQLRVFVDPVDFFMADPAVKVKIQMVVITRDGRQKLLERVGVQPAWYIHGTWIQGLYLQIFEKELAHLQRVTIAVGTEKFTYSGEQIISGWRRINSDTLASGTVVFQAPDRLGPVSSLPWILQPILNWSGDAVYLKATLKYSLIPILLVVLLCFFVWQSQTLEGRNWCRKILGLDNNQSVGIDTQFGQEKWWNWIGLGFLLGALAFLEIREPFYFNQDDNMVDCLPVILVGCRSIWQGEFPNYNPYLFLGSPLANLGMYSLTYPPMLFSYAIARHLLENEFAILEVFAILHLLAGFFATRWLCRQLRLGSLTANLVALSFVLSGAALIMGRSWFNFLPLMVWQPLLFVGLVRLLKGPVTWKWVVGMGLAAGLPFHVGFSQIFIYLNSFFCLAVVYLVGTKTLPWRRALAIVPALLVGAALAVPLVYQQWLFAGNVTRSAATSQGIGLGLPAFFFPFPLIQARAPTGWGNVNLEYMGHLYFFGGLLAFLCLLQVVGLTLFRPGKNHLGGLVWLFCALFIFWLGLGDVAGLWTLVSKLPVVGFINRYPMRLLPFLTFFSCMAGGVVLDRILHSLSHFPGRRLILVGVALVLLGWHVINCRTAFYCYNFSPYPPLPEKMQEAFWQGDQLTGRVSSWGRIRSFDAHYPLLMANNLPAVYRLPTLDGYNPLLEGKEIVDLMYKFLQKDPVPAMRAYGVRWHLTHPEGRVPGVTTYANHYWFLEAITKNDFLLKEVAPEKFQPLIYQDQGIRVTELTDAAPLAFFKDDPCQSLPIYFRGGGVDVQIPPGQGGRQVVVNFLLYPEMEATVDGQPVKCLPDNWLRIVVQVPEESKLLEIRYSPPWGKGIFLGLGVLVLGLIAGKWAMRLHCLPIN